MYANIIKNELYEYYKGKSGNDQKRFQRGRTCDDGYFFLKLIIEEHWKSITETHIAFTDFEKALDKVDRTLFLTF
jgi:hypothetical protein